MGCIVYNNKITVVRGDSVSVPRRIRDSKLLDYAIEEGDSVKFYLKKYLNGPMLIEKEIPYNNPTLIISGEETNELKAGVYVFDIEFSRGDYVDTIINQSQFIVKEGVN